MEKQRAIIYGRERLAAQEPEAAAAAVRAGSRSCGNTDHLPDCGGRGCFQRTLSRTTARGQDCIWSEEQTWGSSAPCPGSSVSCLALKNEDTAKEGAVWCGAGINPVLPTGRPDSHQNAECFQLWLLMWVTAEDLLFFFWDDVIVILGIGSS